MLAFVLHSNLEEVYGVEVCESRYLLGECAIRRLAALSPSVYTIEKWDRGQRIVLATTSVWSYYNVYVGGKI